MSRPPERCRTEQIKSEWFETELNHLLLTALGSNPAINFLMCAGHYPTSLRNIGGFTQVPARDFIDVTLALFTLYEIVQKK